MLAADNNVNADGCDGDYQQDPADAVKTNVTSIAAALASLPRYRSTRERSYIHKRMGYGPGQQSGDRTCMACA